MYCRANEKGVIEQFSEFSAVMEEYMQMDHAELVPVADLYRSPARKSSGEATLINLYKISGCLASRLDDGMIVYSRQLYIYI